MVVRGDDRQQRNGDVSWIHNRGLDIVAEGCTPSAKGDKCGVVDRVCERL